MSFARSALHALMKSGHVAGAVVMPACASRDLLKTHGIPIRYSGIAQTLPSYVFSDVFSQCATSSGGTRSEIAVTAPPQTCVSTGPVAHWAPMSGPGLGRGGGLERGDEGVRGLLDDLDRDVGVLRNVRRHGGGERLVRAGASASPQNHMVRLTFSPLAAALVAPEAAGVELAAVVAVFAIGRRRTRRARGPPRRRRCPIQQAFDPRATARMAPPPRSAPTFTVSETATSTGSADDVTAARASARERAGAQKDGGLITSTQIDDLVADRGDAVRPRRVERDAVAGARARCVSSPISSTARPCRNRLASSPGCARGCRCWSGPGRSSQTAISKAPSSERREQLEPERAVRRDDRAARSAAHDAGHGAAPPRAGGTATCRARRRCCAASPATGRAGRAPPGSASRPRRRPWRTAAPASGRARDGGGGWLRRAAGAGSRGSREPRLISSLTENRC